MVRHPACGLTLPVYTYSHYHSGDLVFLSVLGKRLLFVNSFQHAYELFEKRSGNYADRPTSVMSNELYVPRLHLPFLPPLSYLYRQDGLGF